MKKADRPKCFAVRASQTAIDDLALPRSITNSGVIHTHSAQGPLAVGRIPLAGFCRDAGFAPAASGELVIGLYQVTGRTFFHPHIYDAGAQRVFARAGPEAWRIVRPAL
jgi:hypothetical protein